MLKYKNIINFLKYTYIINITKLKLECLNKC